MSLIEIGCVENQVIALYHNNTLWQGGIIIRQGSIVASSTSEDEQGRIAAMALITGSTIPTAIVALVKLDVFEAFARARNNSNNNGTQLSMTAQEIANLAMHAGQVHQHGLLGEIAVDPHEPQGV